ncbi:MAG: GNAT family N-acetyltransferase [Thermoleophilia bacterium]
METPPPLVRATREGDVDAVAELTAEALAAKYRPAFGDHAARGIAAVLRCDLDGVEGTRHWVAEIDGRVAGAVHLVLSEDAGLDYLKAIADELGWARSLRATAVLSMLGHGRLTPDEAYIDELAVAAWARRRGVAKALLARCELEARATGRKRLTLWVTEDNDAARPLYDRAGFLPTRRRRWIAGRWLFGSPGAVFMARELPPR